MRSDGRGGSHHKDLQELIKSVAETYAFQAVIEQSVLDGAGSVDVSLEKEGLRIACEVSVTSSSDYECKNVLKGLRAGYDHVVVVVSNQKNIQALTAKLRSSIPVEDQSKIKVLSISGLLSFLREVGRPPVANGKQEKLAGQRLDFKEAASFFDVSATTLYRWVQAGKVPFIRVGRLYQFDRDVLVLLGKHDLSGKKKAVVNLDPVRIEKAKPKGKQQKDDRYRKMLNLD